MIKKISIPTPRRVAGNSKRSRFSKAQSFEETVKQNWHFHRYSGVQTKNPSTGVVWIVFGTTQPFFFLDY